MTRRIALVPVPLRCEVPDGAPFVLGAATSVAVGETPAEIAVGYLAADLLGRLGRGAVELLVGADGADVTDDVVALRLAHLTSPGDERYRLVVQEGRAVIEAHSTTGLVRGIATLGQLLAPGVDGTASAPAAVVEDAPRYPWRGLCLDVGPQVADVADLKVVVSLLAAYKLNVLHLHLPDQPGGAATGEARADLAAFAELHGVTVVEGPDVPRHHDGTGDPGLLVEAAAAGARVVLSPAAHVRLDRPVSLHQAYAWDPAALVPGLPAGAVAGVEALVRTRDVQDLDELLAVLLPRLAAVAEVGWSAQALRDWDGFRVRVAHHGVLWERAGLEWTPSDEVDWVPAQP